MKRVKVVLLLWRGYFRCVDAIIVQAFEPSYTQNVTRKRKAVRTLQRPP